MIILRHSYIQDKKRNSIIPTFAKKKMLNTHLMWFVLKWVSRIFGILIQGNMAKDLDHVDPVHTAMVWSENMVSIYADSVSESTLAILVLKSWIKFLLLLHWRFFKGEVYWLFREGGDGGVCISGCAFLLLKVICKFWIF